MRHILCLLGFHRMKGTAIPHTFRCARPRCPVVRSGNHVI